MAKILLVEDERNLSNLIRRNLEDDGHGKSSIIIDTPFASTMG